MLNEGMSAITVESDVFAAADPPPLTVAALIWGEDALPATFTVTVIAG